MRIALLIMGFACSFSIHVHEALAGTFALSGARNTFAFKLYDVFLEKDGKNFTFSPYSAFELIGVAYLSSSNKTAADISELLGVTNDQSSFWQALAHDQKTFQPVDRYLTSNSRILNFCAIEQQFADSLCSQLGVESIAMKPNLSEIEISAAVDSMIYELTDARIELFPEGIHGPPVCFILLNVLRFDCLWRFPFSPERTQPAPFYTSVGDTVFTDFMYTKIPLAGMKVAQHNGFRMFQVPFESDAFVMQIILASGSISLNKPKLMKQDYEALVAALHFTDTEANIALPRLSISYKADLSNCAKQFGASQAFSPSADFAKLFPMGGVWLEECVQATQYVLSESGVRVHSETAGIVRSKSHEARIDLTANHPFTFLIIHVPTNTIVVMGRVNDPTE